MSILADKTEKKAVALLAKTLRFFESTTLLYMSATDAFEARQAENLIKGIIATNGYEALTRSGKVTIRKQSKK